MHSDVRSIASRHLGRDVEAIRDVPDGFGHHTFIVDGEWVFRFARSPEVAEQDRIEGQVLPIVERSVSFAVPRFDFVGTHKGLTYVGYRRIPGRPLRRSDVPEIVSPADLAEFLHELHSVDTGALAGLAGGDGTAASWKGRYGGLRQEAESTLLEIVPDRVLRDVDSAFDRFFAAGFDFTPVVVHGDLGTSHILVDEGDGLIGLLDFEAVSIGDPAVDFVGMVITLGLDVSDEVMALYPGLVDDGFRERAIGYWWIGSLSAVLHGVNTDDQSIIDSGIAGLTGRLAKLARLA